jgi:hypothetical protein
MGDRSVAFQMATQVEGGTRERRHGQLADMGDLVGCDPLFAHDDSGARSRVLDDHLDRRRIVHPLRAMQGSRGASGDDAPAARPEPGGDGIDGECAFNAVR